MTGILFFGPACEAPLATELTSSGVGLLGSRSIGDGFGLLYVANPAPSIADIFVRAEGSICQQEQSRLAVLRIPGAALLSDLDEAQRDQFADGGGDLIVVDAVLDEVIIRAGEVAVLLGLTAVALELNLQPGEDTVRRQAQHPIRRAIHHLDQARSEWAGYVLFRDAGSLPDRLRRFCRASGRQRIAGLASTSSALRNCSFWLSMPAPPLGEGDLTRDNPVFRLQAGRRCSSASDARIIRPDPKLFSVLVRRPADAVATHRRIALELAEESRLLVECSLERTALAGTQFDKLTVDAPDLGPRMYRRPAA